LTQISPKTVSQLLANWRAGNNEALQATIPLVYKELRRIAQRNLRRERPDHTLQSSALVHEVYLRLEKQGAVEFKNRDHFLAICSSLMRQILVEYARRRRADKRDGGIRVTLDDEIAFKERDLDIVSLHEALDELEKLSPLQSQIVELRFFGGLSIEETAKVTETSPATVKRHWETARHWLHRQMTAGSKQ
jgi:RNA polymerase sigma factor (TIGR02999 family)